MLNRQKAIIEILTRAQRPVTHLQLTKLCFLLRHQFDSQGGSAFYDFVPYKFGPFSFALFQEVGKLVNQGFVAEQSSKSWELGEVEADTSKLDKFVRADIDELVGKYGSFSKNRLIDYVYESHPRFTINSEIKKLQRHPKAKEAIFTAGYEGLSVDAFLDMLSRNGVKRIVDVRKNPIARRYGFHRSTLNRLSGNLGIDYKHVPELGIHSDQRQNLDAQSDRDRLFDRYEATTLAESQPAIDTVAQYCSEMPSVLVCMEREPCTCHRARLAPFVSQKTGLPIEHLMPDVN
ncbi:MAG: DUF488 domain-containing protein [Planctomycetota bacterium]